MRRDLGDFQTPPELVGMVLETLGPIGARWPRVLEPTCGRGHFVSGILAHSTPPREVLGVEIQPEHCRAAGEAIRRHDRPGTHAAITCADFFRLDLARDLAWRERGPLLVVGNPPWITSAALGGLGSASGPPRSNVKGLSGLEARTGSANFDVAEAVWLKLARELANENPTIAILCKTSVARGLLAYSRNVGLPVAVASIHRIDASRWFGASVDACLFCATISGRAGRTAALAAPVESDGVPVYDGLDSHEPAAVMGFARGRPVADLAAYHRRAFADGECSLTWRQGIKHDAADIMELIVEPTTGRLVNGLGETVDVETEFVYPLLKGADLRRPATDRPRRAMVVTQRRVGEDTSRLQSEAPRLWRYLQSHAARFGRRRSSIYRGRPAFSLFGVGPYSFAPYKVAVSGLHRSPSFRAIGPREGRPAVFDDTSYFVACESAAKAAAVSAVCNDPIALELLDALSFADAKRPMTKALLRRLDLRTIAAHADSGRLRDRALGMAAELEGEAGTRLREDIEEALTGFEDRN
ncbi:MAG: class I SAM-dependent methyltransferase [Isosphaeraceae bacterium]